MGDLDTYLSTDGDGCKDVPAQTTAANQLVAQCRLAHYGNDGAAQTSMLTFMTNTCENSARREQLYLNRDESEAVFDIFSWREVVNRIEYLWFHAWTDVQFNPYRLVMHELTFLFQFFYGWNFQIWELTWPVYGDRTYYYFWAQTFVEHRMLVIFALIAKAVYDAWSGLDAYQNRENEYTYYSGTDWAAQGPFDATLRSLHGTILLSKVILSAVIPFVLYMVVIGFNLAPGTEVTVDSIYVGQIYRGSFYDVTLIPFIVALALQLITPWVLELILYLWRAQRPYDLWVLDLSLNSVAVVLALEPLLTGVAYLLVNVIASFGEDYYTYSDPDGPGTYNWYSMKFNLPCLATQLLDGGTDTFAYYNCLREQCTFTNRNNAEGIE